MKTSWNWLGEWIGLDGLDPEAIAEQLTMAGLEVEGVEFLGRGHDDIVVARIDAIEEHPKADRLVICHVDAGEGELRQIVCGATNMSAGDRVPAALPGSQPPTFDFVIGERKMRGALSQGMLCAAEELGIDDGVDGLMILPESFEVGTPVFEALGLKDVVFEIGLTPNRPDCLSHYGVAREIAALTGRALRPRPEHTDEPLWAKGDTHAKDVCTLTIEDAQGCPRYAFSILDGVTVGPSPQWLISRLASIGVRSINNIVDITNYVLFDVGQPLHAFDLDKLHGPSIVVRRAREGESFMGINHKEYELAPQDLVIADAERAVALAGVMGGEETEVTEATSRILLECAYFDPTTVRKSSKRHVLHTDSSHRFERGIDPGAIARNLQRATAMLAEVAGDVAVAQGIGFAEEAPPEAHTIELPTKLPNRVLGTSLETERIVEVLASIGLKVEQDEDVLTVHVPTWRPDLERPIDLVEEVARLIGYDNIGESLPARTMGGEHEMRTSDEAHPRTLLSHEYRAEVRRVRAAMLDHGFYEAVNYSFMGTEQLDHLGLTEDHPLRDARPVDNPLTSDQEFMRTSLLPGLLRNVETNIAQRHTDVALFEVGRRYLADGAEPLTLGMAVVGEKSSHWSRREEWDFYDLKGIVEALGEHRALEGARWRVPSATESYLHPGVQAEWLDGDDERLALVGRIHPKIEQDHDVPGAFVAEVDLARLLGYEARTQHFEPLPKYPAIVRDYAFSMDTGTPFDALLAQIHGLADEDASFGELLQSVEVFDVYEGEHVAEGKRSVALKVTYRAEDRTLTDDEVAEASQALVSRLEDHTGVQQR